MPGDTDVNAGRRGAKAPVALVGDDYQGTRFGHQEVGAANPQVGGQELLPQRLPGYAGHLFNVVGEGYS